MSPDTKRSVDETLKNGWYRKSMVLGEGGWPTLYVNGINNWHTYVLLGLEGEIESIKAKDDETAYKAFSTLYYLDMIEEWEIHQRLIEYRLVKSSE